MPPSITCWASTNEPPSLSKETVNHESTELLEFDDELGWLLLEEFDEAEELAELEESEKLDELGWLLDEDGSLLLVSEELRRDTPNETNVIPDPSSKRSKIDIVRTLFF